MAKPPKKPAKKAAPKKPTAKKPAPKKKETTDPLSTLAAKVLAGKKPTKKEALALAASVLSQDVTKGKRKPKPKRK